MRGKRRWTVSAVYQTRFFVMHVLSFLQTKEAALTSVLSKRWRDLLAFVPNIDLDDNEFLHPEEGKRERDGVLQSFIDFVDRVLALQGNSAITKFSLMCDTGVSSDCVDRWIRKVLQRGVSELRLCNNFDNEFRMPPEVFVTKTLVLLKLVRISDIDCRVLGVSLPMLKSLFLFLVGFCVDQFETLLPACPLLEILHIEDFKWTNSNVTVSSASLEDLIIVSDGCVDLINPASISFDTPSVVFLDYADFVAEDYPKVNLTNVVRAQINLKLTEGQIQQARAQNIHGVENDEDDVFLRFGNVWKFFSGIKNVQQLYLRSDTLDVLSLCRASLPVFNNLNALCISSKIDRGWQAMPVLLKNCPHLETLILDGLLHHVTDKCGDVCDCISREEKGRSLISCPVKMLQITRFRGKIKEIQMIKHFLDYFPSLKKMEVYPEEYPPTNVEVSENHELIMMMFRLCNQFYSCEVQFMDKKWTAAQ